MNDLAVRLRRTGPVEGSRIRVQILARKSSTETQV